MVLLADNIVGENLGKFPPFLRKEGISTLLELFCKGSRKLPRYRSRSNQTKLRRCESNEQWPELQTKTATLNKNKKVALKVTLVAIKYKTKKVNNNNRELFC